MASMIARRGVLLGAAALAACARRANSGATAIAEKLGESRRRPYLLMNTRTVANALTTARAHDLPQKHVARFDVVHNDVRVCLHGDAIIRIFFKETSS